MGRTWDGGYSTREKMGWVSIGHWGRRDITKNGGGGRKHSAV